MLPQSWRMVVPWSSSTSLSGLPVTSLNDANSLTVTFIIDKALALVILSEAKNQQPWHKVWENPDARRSNGCPDSPDCRVILRFAQNDKGIVGALAPRLPAYETNIQLLYQRVRIEGKGVAQRRNRCLPISSLCGN